VSFFGINLASRALQAHQQALEVTGQNIANVDTSGYSRQVAVTRSVAGPGVEMGGGTGNPLAPGGGVEVALIQRTHAAWLDQATAGLQMQMGQATVSQQFAGQVESLLAEPGDAGLASTLDRFFAAFGNLSSHPDDPAARSGALQAGSEVAQRFRDLTQGLDQVHQDLINQARENVQTINDLARQVAALGKSIRQAQAAGASPNELLDQRDQLLADLTKRTGATVSGQAGGELVVSIGGFTLVQGENVEALDLSVGGPLQVVRQDSGEVVNIAGGELQAQQEWANDVLPGYRARFAAVRDQFAAAVNTLHQSGKDLDGSPGQPFYVTDATGNLAVNPVLQANLRKVAAGQGAPGDGSVASAIAGLGTATGSVLPAYHTLVGDIGVRASESQQRLDQTTLGLQQLEGQQASQSGVNLDEELAQMVSLQHAYAASARLLSTFVQMLSTLIEQTGR
jgi:flagellar hook-associated protein 1 FlgK